MSGLDVDNRVQCSIGIEIAKKTMLQLLEKRSYHVLESKI